MNLLRMPRLERGRLKQLFFTTLGWAGHERRLLERLAAGQDDVILNLHRVSPVDSPFWPPLQPALFEELLRFLKGRFTVTTLEGLRAASKRPRVVLSFDDGYQDFVEHAMPRLERHGIVANQNVIPACVLSGTPPWNVRLYDFLAMAPAALISELRLPGFDAQLRSTGTEDCLRYGLALSRFLKLRSRAERAPLWALIEPVIAKLGGIRSTRMMSLDDLGRVVAAGHEVGVHSYSHDSMGYESNEFFQQDLQACIEFFRDRLHRKLTVYAFPNGSHRPEQIAMLEQAGVEHVLLVEERLSRDPRVHTRLTVAGESAAELRFEALGYKAKVRP